MQTNRIYSYDVIKFAAIVAIALMHFNWQSVPQAYIGVEFCFIITGFFLSKNYATYNENDLLNTVLDRIKGFYPYYVIVMLLTFLLIYKDFHIDKIISALLFFPHIGLAPKIGLGPLWFLGAYTYVFAFYMCLFRLIDDRAKVKYVVGLLVVCSLMLMMKISPAMNINYSLEREQFIGFIPFGVARGIAGIGLGFLLGELTDNYNKNPFSKLSAVVEIFSLSCLIYIILHRVSPRFDVIAYVLISILVVSLYYKSSFVSRNLENVRAKFINLFSLSMQVYIFHGLIIKCFGNYLKAHFKDHDLYIIIYLASVLLFCFAMRYLYTKSLPLWKSAVPGSENWGGKSPDYCVFIKCNY